MEFLGYFGQQSKQSQR